MNKKKLFKTHIHIQQCIDHQLNIYQEKYKSNIMDCLNSDSLSKSMFELKEFDTKRLNEFIELYETKYPERKQAFLNFFRKTDKSFFDHMLKIKAMSYMMDEKIIAKMTNLMQKRNGIYIQLFSCKNPVPYGASAYVGRDFWGRLRIMYYDIAAKSRLHPPYKTFFHELGHSLDALMVRGRGFFSDRFKCTKHAVCKKLYYDDSNHQFYIQKLEKVYKKTIHEWTAFDVENYILQTAVDLIISDISLCSSRRYLHPALTPYQKYRIIDFMVHHLFLKPDGDKRLKNLSGKPYFHEIHDLYSDVAEKMNKTIFANYKNIVVLPRDLFGGITNNQLGGGHNSTYWFKGNRRVNKVSREAFAGYFEYKTTIFDSAFQCRLINPYDCMPNTVFALEEMLNTLLNK